MAEATQHAKPKPCWEAASKRASAQPAPRGPRTVNLVFSMTKRRLARSLGHDKTKQNRAVSSLVRTSAPPASGNAATYDRPSPGRQCADAPGGPAPGQASPWRSRYPQATAARRARATATAGSGRGKWNKQLGGTRARESEWRQNLKINRPLRPLRPLAAAAAPSSLARALAIPVWARVPAPSSRAAPLRKEKERVSENPNSPPPLPPGPLLLPSPPPLPGRLRLPQRDRPTRPGFYLAPAASSFPPPSMVAAEDEAAALP